MEDSWKEYVSKAKEPSTDELAQFHADLACDDAEGYIANSMAGRVKEFETNILEKAMPRLSQARFSMRIVRVGRH